MARWAAAGVVGQIRDQLAARIRRQMGRGPRAVATVIDSQSVKAASPVGKDSRGYDAGKKIHGRKRHLVVDTRGQARDLGRAAPEPDIKTVSRPRDTSGFVVLPRRWVVERPLAWIMYARRHARDYERLVKHSGTLITWAAITLMTRRHRDANRLKPRPALVLITEHREAHLTPRIETITHSG